MTCREMYNGIGLRTVRGSGTNGYVTKNKSFVIAVSCSVLLVLSLYITRRLMHPAPTRSFLQSRQQQAMKRGRFEEEAPLVRREPNKELIDHDKKRRIEVKVMELRDDLEEKG